MANPYNPNDYSNRDLNDPYARETEGNGAGLFAGLVVAAILVIGGLFMYYHNDTVRTASDTTMSQTSSSMQRAPAGSGAPNPGLSARPTAPAATPAPATPNPATTPAQ